MSDITSAILDRLGDGQSRLWIGTVAATPTGQALSVTVAGTTLTGIRWLSSYRPLAGDVVSLAQIGSDWLVLGKLAMNGGTELASLLDSATVTAVDTTAKTLTMTWAGTSIAGVRWLGSYTPAVGHTVVVLRVVGQWLVLGQPSTALSAVVEPPPTPTVPTTNTMVLSPSTQWDGKMPSGGSWSWSKDAPVYQGKGKEWHLMQAPPTYTRAGYWIFNPSIASQIPSGATIRSAKVTVSRSILDGGADTPVSAVLYGHTRTAASANPSGAPSFAAGFGPWKPGGLTNYQYATWDLPSGWVAALVAGTITGLGIYSTSAADFGCYSIALAITYSI